MDRPIDQALRRLCPRLDHLELAKKGRKYEVKLHTILQGLLLAAVLPSVGPVHQGPCISTHHRTEQGFVLMVGERQRCRFRPTSLVNTDSWRLVTKQQPNLSRGGNREKRCVNSMCVTEGGKQIRWHLCLAGKPMLTKTRRAPVSIRRCSSLTGSTFYP
jgi:hypothetical protein